MRKLIVLGLVGPRRPAHRRLPRHGVRRHRPRRCCSPPASRPAAASAAVHFSEIGTTLVSGFSHHKLGNVDWRTVGDPRRARLRRRLRRRDAPVQPRRRRSPSRSSRCLLLALGVYVIYRFLAPRRRAARRSRAARPRSSSPRWASSAGALDADRRRRLGPGRHHLAALLAAGSSRARWSARSTPRSSSSRSAARSASCSRSAARASTGATPRALLVGGVIAAPIAAWLVKHLAARVLGVAAGGLIVLTNSKTIARGRSAPPVPTVALVIAASSPSLWVTGIVWAVQQERRSREVDASSRSACATV